MDDKRGGHENTTTKTVLTFAVTFLSRKHVDKTNGQEVIWKKGPSDWPQDLLGLWKNPTSVPKDSTYLLWKKYEYLRSQVPNHKLNQEELKAFEDFKPGKIERVKSFMCYKIFTDTLNKIKNQLYDMQEPHLMWIKEDLQLLLSSIASTSKGPTAADTSSLSTLSRKRKSDSRISVQGKEPKTEMSNCGNFIHGNSRRQKEIVPKPTQTASNESLPVFAQKRGTPKSTAVESPLGYTASLSQSLLFLVSSKNTLSNMCVDSSKCTTSTYSTEAAAATNVQSSIVTNPTEIMDPLPCSSHEEPPMTASHCFPTSSKDSGTWSEESNKVKETSIQLDQEKLNDKNVQDILEFIQNSQNNNVDGFLMNDDCLIDFDSLKYFDEAT